jgi:thiamine pyrophosphokinase
MANKKVCFFSDNMAVGQVINKQTAKDDTDVELSVLVISPTLKNVWKASKNIALNKERW